MMVYMMMLILLGVVLGAIRDKNRRSKLIKDIDNRVRENYIKNGRIKQ